MGPTRAHAARAPPAPDARRAPAPVRPPAPAPPAHAASPGGHRLADVRVRPSDGEPLGPLRGPMESSFLQDLGRVRVHRDGAAERLGVEAFAQGERVHLAGRVDPATGAGRTVLGHEIAHVLQQRAGRVASGPRTAEGILLDEAGEREADAAGALAARGLPVQFPGLGPSMSHEHGHAHAASVPIQAFRYRQSAPTTLFAIQASTSSTVPLSQTVTYTVAPTGNANPADYAFAWTLHNDPTTRADHAEEDLPPLTIRGPRNARSWTLRSVYPGTHRISVQVTRGETPVETIEFEQTVTDDGRTPLHREIRDLAGATTVDPGVREWDTHEFASWMVARDMSEEIGSLYIHGFKEQWVRAHRRTIRAAAARFDVPDLLLAGVLYHEVGGDPLWADPLAHAVRQLPGTAPADRTSFGNASLQVRRAGETLGYTPGRLVGSQESQIISSLEDPRESIFVAASHLADLRDVDFPGRTAGQMTLEEITITATRYNRGPDLTREQIETNLSYGRTLVNRFGQLHRLMRD